ncbi:hypothetical protein [Streptomyces sp. NPDC059378]|uniref:hypothetical protein n=1 Tax=Streptomyces sp. NPDC059378 TaxID=3346815 RepID=UPI0036B7DE96
MNGFSSLRHARRRTTIGIGLAIAALVGFGAYNTIDSDTEGVAIDVDFVLGGGGKAIGAGDADTLAIHGRYRGLASAPDGTIYLFTQEDRQMVMWRKPKSGIAERIPISGMNEQHAAQAAVAADGSVYLAAGDLWKVSRKGKASKIVDTDCADAKLSPIAERAADLCVSQVTGVTVTGRGAIYIGDEITWKKHGSYVHRLDGDAVELIAGRPPTDGESLKRSNPAVRNAINPTPGVAARDALVPDVWNSGWLSADGDALYWRTGPGIVRINTDGTLSPFVGAKAPKDIKEPGRPFEAIGRALDAEIAPSTGDLQQGDVATVPKRTEVYYSDAGKIYRPPFSAEYDWNSIKTDSQQEFMDHLVGGKAVYRVTSGEISPALVGVQAISASKEQLYVAAESKVGDTDSPESWSTAVLQLHLP